MDMLTCALQDNKLICTSTKINNYRQIKLLIKRLFKKMCLKEFFNYQRSLHAVFLRVACSKVYFTLGF